MSVIVNPLALGWKFNHAEGIECCENARGQMELVKWPASLGAWPTQAQADQWASEYAARDKKEEIYQEAINGPRSRLLRAYIACINDGSIIPATNMTAAQIKAAIKAKL